MMMVVVMVPVAAPLVTPLRLFLTLFPRRSLHQPLQRRPLFLIQTLPNLLYVRHFLTIPSGG